MAHQNPIPAELPRADSHEAAIRDMNARYRAIFENNYVTMLIIDPIDGRIVDANPAASRFYGYTIETLKGMKISDINTLAPEQLKMAMERARTFASNEFYFKHRLANGEVRDVEVFSGPIDVQGRQLLYSIIHDVTEQQKAEEILARSYDFYITLFEQFPALIWRSDTEGNINYVNDALLQFIGQSYNEISGMKWLALVHPDDRDWVRKDQYDYINARKSFQMEYQLLHKDGTYHWIIDVGQPFEDIHGEYAGYIGMFFDITDRKRAENRTKHINRLYALLSQINQLIVQANEETTLLREVCKIAVEYGKFKMSWIGMYDPDSNEIKPVATYGDEGGDLQKVVFSVRTEEDKNNPVQRAFLTEKTCIVNRTESDVSTSHHREGAIMYGIRSAAIVPLRFKDSAKGILAFYATEESFFDKEEITLLEEVAEDISFALQKIEAERLREEAERSLQLSEERFRTLVQSMDDIVFVLGVDLCVAGVYGRWLEAFGYEQESLVGKSLFDLFEPEEASFHEKMVRRSLNGEHVTYVWAVDFSGKRYYVQLSLSPLRDPAGHVKGVVGVGRDITELREAQEAQRIQSAALESAANAVMLIDRNGTILWTNPAFTKMTGFTSEEVIGMNPRVLKSGAHDDVFYQKLWDVVLSGNVWSGEIINKRKDGTLYHEEMTITPVADATGEVTHFIAIKQDVTHQKQLQQHLFQVQKLESIGTLASGIAHDFNNILGIILGYASLMEKSRDDDEKFGKNIRAITKAVNRGASLVQQILTFARKTDVNFETVDVNAVVKELTRMLEETFPKNISISLQLAEKIPPLVMDQGQLHQALLNLCVNSRDAIQDCSSEAGVISIRTNVVAGTRLRKEYPEAENSTYISISVADNGIGIEERMIDRVIEPFFTTKEKGRGTGLGLSVVYGIVKTYQGFLDIQSRKGVGTTVTIYLPVRWSSVGLEKSVGTIPSDAPGGSETILVVEDEELLRDALVTMLASKGYTVLIASDGLEAMELIERHKSEIALVMSDFGLPHIDGAAIYRRIRGMNVHIPFILASGYFDPEEKKRLESEGIRYLIRKPYQPVEILIKIREIVDKSSHT